MQKSFALLGLLLSIVSTGQVQLVTNLNDNGPGSLRSAIAAASSGDTVQFDTSLFQSGNDTIFLSSELLIDESLLIRGSIKSGDTIFISGDQSTRVFKVDFQNPPTGMVIFEDLAIVKGFFSQTQGGGGIYSEFVDTLILKNCYFEANRVSFNGEGAAIRSWWSNTFVYDCTFIDNTASGSSYCTGGAISALYCDVHTERSVYKRNMASGGGGAIYVEEGGCVARSSLFERNYTTLLITSPGGGMLHQWY
ncbi:MAG: right-handed parallel beta-helix repeat-containing protein [Owenweeksia sp.]|nr:right-handed parallel beta-helix repeat-containing protein [Owenweeksia sp.]